MFFLSHLIYSFSVIYGNTQSLFYAINSTSKSKSETWVFIFLGCVAIVLKDWFILQDNKFIKTVTAWSDFEWWTPVLFKSVTAYSDSVGFVEPLWAQCNSMLRFSKEISLIAICNFLIINPCKIWNCHDIRRFFQLDHYDSILRFFQDQESRYAFYP